MRFDRFGKHGQLLGRQGELLESPHVHIGFDALALVVIKPVNPIPDLHTNRGLEECLVGFFTRITGGDLFLRFHPAFLLLYLLYGSAKCFVALFQSPRQGFLFHLVGLPVGIVPRFQTPLPFPAHIKKKDDDQCQEEVPSQSQHRPLFSPLLISCRRNRSDLSCV